MIQVQGLTHCFGSHTALRDVSLEVPPGTVVGLVGANGAGKTTLLRCAATLLAPTKGQVLVNGRSTVTDARAVRRLVGYLPERASPRPDLLVWEQLDGFGRIAGHRGEALRARVRAALERSGLAARRGSLVRELSKGLRQRLALESVLLHDPSALLLDEPTDGLDPVSREQLLALVRSLAHSGAAVLLSSHVLAELEQIADEVVILVEGRRHPDAHAAASPRRFRLRVRRDSDRAEAILRAHAEVGDVAREADAMVFTLAPEAADAGNVVTALCADGLAVIELVEERENLRARFHRALQPPPSPPGGSGGDA